MKRSGAVVAEASGTQTPKPGWCMVRFDEIAENITDRVDDPSKAGVDRYVGLEHLDPNSLKIRRWGVPTDVEATKLRFQPGDIIFGKRRAYQRKLAVADFEGICSAHAMVLRAKPSGIVREFLPFFMQSDAFFERALAISVGSLSPTINWSSLACQRFAVPSERVQLEAATVLSAVDRVLDAYVELVSAVRATRAAHTEATLRSLRSVGCVKLGELFTKRPENGYSPVPAGSDTGHSVLTGGALSPNGYSPNNLKPVVPDDKVLAARLQTGDFLVCRSNTIDLVGLAGIFSEVRTDVSFPDTFMRLSIDEARIDKRFLELVLLSSLGRAHMRRVAAGTSASMKKINRNTLERFRLLLPEKTVQEHLVMSVQSIDAVLKRAGACLSSVQWLKAAVMEHLIGDGRRNV